MYSVLNKNERFNQKKIDFGNSKILMTLKIKGHGL